MTWDEYNDMMNEDEDGLTPAFARKTTFAASAANRLDSPLDFKSKQRRKTDMAVSTMFEKKEEY